MGADADKRSSSGEGRLKRRLYELMYRWSPRVRVLQYCAMGLAVVLVIASLWVMNRMLETRSETHVVNDAHDACQEAAGELQNTSDFLTREARLFVRTGDPTYLDHYVDEIAVRDRRGDALQVLYDHAASKEATQALELARMYSDQLAETELYALKLVMSARGIPGRTGILENVSLTAEDEALTSAEKSALAAKLMYSNDYADLKANIHDQVVICSKTLVGSLSTQLEALNARLALQISAMRTTVVLLLVVLMVTCGSTMLFLLIPISMHEKSIRSDQPLADAGAAELRVLGHAYNDMYDKYHDREEHLSYEAGHDALTGVYNRGSFDSLLTRHKHGSALLLVDVDYFKHFNDDYGHDMGDAVLIEVAAVLFASFRSTDYICRIGGDEFAVIATNMGPDLEDVIAHKIRKVQAFLRDTSNGLPAVTISVGVAFGDDTCTDEELFQSADSALYQVKESGRDGYAFTMPDNE